MPPQDEISNKLKTKRQTAAFKAMEKAREAMLPMLQKGNELVVHSYVKETFDEFFLLNLEIITGTRPSNNNLPISIKLLCNRFREKAQLDGMYNEMTIDRPIPMSSLGSLRTPSSRPNWFVQSQGRVQRSSFAPIFDEIRSIPVPTPEPVEALGDWNANPVLSMDDVVSMEDVLGRSDIRFHGAETGAPSAPAVGVPGCTCGCNQGMGHDPLVPDDNEEEWLDRNNGRG